MRNLTANILTLLFFLAGFSFVTAQESAQNENDPTPYIGIWEYPQEGHKLTLFVNKEFHWEKRKDCPKAPCPVEMTAGTYTARGNKLYLDPHQGEDVVLKYTVFGEHPEKITIVNMSDDKTYEYEYTGDVINK